MNRTTILEFLEVLEVIEGGYRSPIIRNNNT